MVSADEPRIAGALSALEGILRDLRARDGDEARVVEIRCADQLRVLAEVLDACSD